MASFIFGLRSPSSVTVPLKSHLGRGLFHFTFLISKIAPSDIIATIRGSAVVEIATSLPYGVSFSSTVTVASKLGVGRSA